MSSEVRVGITGHRKLGAAEDWVAGALRELLRGLRRWHGDDLVTVSAIAVGADTLFAEAALELGIPLEVVRPYADYIQAFPTGPVRDRYEALLARATAVHHLPHTRKGSEAYMAAGVWVVDHCEVLVAVHDGRDPKNTGGTADVVHYARSVGRRLVLANPATRTIEEGTD